MEHVSLWEFDPQPSQQVETFNEPESLLPGHTESPYLPCWAGGEIHSDINLMSDEPLAAFDPMMSLHLAKSIQQPQWQPDYDPSQEVLLQEISNSGHFMPHFNPSPAPAHVSYTSYPNKPTFGNVTSTSSAGSYGGGRSSSNRPYGAGSPSSSMFVPQRIISTDRNVVVESSRRDYEEPPKMTSFNPGPYVNSAATAAATLPTPKPVSLPLPIPNSARQHRQVSSSPVMNLSGFEPSPRPMSQVTSSPRPMSQVSSSPRPMSQVTSSPRPMSQVSTSPRPMSQVSTSPRPMSQVSSSPRPMSQVSSSPGFEPSRPMNKVSSSPVMSMSYGEQRVMGNSPSLSFEPRHPKSSLGKPGSSPISTVIGFEPIPQSSSLPNILGGSPQQRQQQQQPAMSTSPPLSNLSFEPRQPPPTPSMSNSPSTSNLVSNLVFEPRRPPPNPTPRQQATTSNINNNPRSDVVEPVSMWPPLRIVGSEKARIFSPQTDTIKYPIPKSTTASSIPAPNALNPVHKRSLYMDDNKNNTQGGNMNKKPMQNWQGGAGCSRLEEISNAAHQKVTQNTSGRALGPALNTNLKPRARQGSANDPQSIAARVRRERISERLKVLQTLIPNGDKVDMVTMLEKAINYVQCLELQIRMLKNDSLWPKALGPLPNTLQELLELAGPEFLGGKDTEETTTATENKTTSTSNKKLVPAEVIEFDSNQPSADKE